VCKGGEPLKKEEIQRRGVGVRRGGGAGESTVASWTTSTIGCLWINKKTGRKHLGGPTGRWTPRRCFKKTCQEKNYFSWSNGVKQGLGSGWFSKKKRIGGGEKKKGWRTVWAFLNGYRQHEHEVLDKYRRGTEQKRGRQKTGESLPPPHPHRGADEGQPEYDGFLNQVFGAQFKRCAGAVVVRRTGDRKGKGGTKGHNVGVRCKTGLTGRQMKKGGQGTGGGIKRRQETETFEVQDQLEQRQKAGV